MNIKLLIFSTILVFGLTIKNNAQINLENDFTGLTYFAYLDKDCYYQPDFNNNTCIVYDLNYNIENTFDLNPPSDMFLYDIAYLSQHVFNTDDALEVLVVFYNYIPTSDTSGYYVYTSQVINENGDILLDVPYGSYNELLQYEDGTLKLMINLYDFSTSTFITNTMIYSIPGTIPTEIKEFNKEPSAKIFPNPANIQANIQYKLNTQGKAKLHISNLDGQLVHSELLNSNNEINTFNTSKLKPGTYMVFIEQNGQKTPAQKLIIH